MLRRLVYVQVHHGYLLGRLLFGGEVIRNTCNALAPEGKLSGDFRSVQRSFLQLFGELRAIRFGLLRPGALIHLVPKTRAGYPVSTLRFFRDVAMKAGVSYPWMLDDRECPLTERQLELVFGGGGDMERAGLVRGYRVY